MTLQAEPLEAMRFVEQAMRAGVFADSRRHSPGSLSGDDMRARCTTRKTRAKTTAKTV
ncbi:MAG: hypothetical protein ABJM73_11200 [Parasphingorhabdus sp.]|uniref:hypothetical protein n=1 Tax=Parasphingorhabdus sp. TaxID=2709688 RepID=UPI003298A3E3